MSNILYIPVTTLCTHYKVETSFFESLNDHGLIEITTIEKSPCVHQRHLKHVESIVRLHQDLHINFEGIDTVFNLLEKVEKLQDELRLLKNRLVRYEDHLLH